MEPLGIETVALLAEANLKSLQRLTELSAGTPVAVVGWGRTCMENLSRSIEGAGLEHLNLIQLYVDEDPKEVRPTDRKSTRLNSSHANISYAVFCLKKKKNIHSVL